MPSQQGNPVHQILCDYPEADSLVQIIETLECRDFVIVQQFYVNRDTRELELKGPLAIHRAVIGKIEELEER
jgi:hypothetical protein